MLFVHIESTLFPISLAHIELCPEDGNANEIHNAIIVWQIAIKLASLSYLLWRNALQANNRNKDIPPGSPPAYPPTVRKRITN